MRKAADAARSRSLWIAACATVVVLFVSPFPLIGGGAENEGSWAFPGAVGLALVGGVLLAVPARTRRVGVGVLIGVAFTVVTVLVVGFFFVAQLANELRDA